MKYGYFITVFIVLASMYSQADISPVDMAWEVYLTGEHRPAEHIKRNSYRHPKATLNFFDVKANSVVVEIWPGAGWYTEVLAPLLKGKGVLYAAHFSAVSDVSYYKKSREKFERKLGHHPVFYSQVNVTTLMPMNNMVVAPAATATHVLTFRNVHNWIKSNTAEAVFEAMYMALKPGGVLGVVEHRAKPGSSDVDIIASGYVTETKVKSLARAAGFTFVAGSDINANNKDTTNHPKGVWTLPPSLRLGDENRDHYLSIGESDRMTLKFIKPLI